MDYATHIDQIRKALIESQEYLDQLRELARIQQASVNRAVDCFNRMNERLAYVEQCIADGTSVDPADWWKNGPQDDEGFSE